MQVSSHSTPLFAFSKPVSQGVPVAKQGEAPDPLTPQAVAAVEKSSGAWQEGAFSFWDLLDVINPLQHIPVVSTIYRKLSGDRMGYAARVAGDTLFSSVFGSFISGLASAVVNVVVDAFTGKDIGEHMMAAVEPAAIPARSVPQAQVREQQSVSYHQAQPVAEVETYLAPVAPTSATSEVHGAEDVVPALNRTVASGVKQYQWQVYAGEVKAQSSYWA